MSKYSALILIFLLLGVFVFANTVDLQKAISVGGEWTFENDRLLQSDRGAGKAKFAIPFKQKGLATYTFNVQYRGGVLEDGHGGFGLHVFADSILQRDAWGVGKSWLLWLNYDIEPEEVLPGLSAQVYESVSHSEMKVIEEFDLNYVPGQLVDLGLDLDQILANPVPVKITVNGVNGEVRVYSPLDEYSYFLFTLPIEEELTGDYLVLRTNGMAVSFGQANEEFSHSENNSQVSNSCLQ